MGEAKVVTMEKAVQIEIKDGFPVIRGGPTRRKGALVEAIRADRKERDQKIRPGVRRK